MTKKRQKNKALYIAAAVCGACVVFMLVALLVPKKTVRGDFTPPAFAADVHEGVPTVEKERIWYTPPMQGQAFQMSVCCNVIVEGNTADIYLTNYAENDVWLMVRLMSVDEKKSAQSGQLVPGDTVYAESGIIKPGEYVKSITFDKLPKNGQKLCCKVMAYQPNTYYSEGSFLLEAVAKIGG